MLHSIPDEVTSPKILLSIKTLNGPKKDTNTVFIEKFKNLQGKIIDLERILEDDR